MKGLLQYKEGKSYLHKLNPITKLLLAIFMCAVCFITSSLIFLISMIILSLVLGFIAGISKTVFSLFKGLIKVSIFLFVIQVLFVQKGTVIVALPLNILITKEGIFSAISLVLKLIGATMPLAIMLSVTKLEDLSNTMVSTLHIPYKYTFAFTSTVRFIPQYFNDMSDIIDAQTARGVELDTKNTFKKLGLILPLCVPLLLISVRKIESTAIAAELRGFNLRTKDSCYYSYPIKFIDYLTLLIGILLVVISIFLIK